MSVFLPAIVVQRALGMVRVILFTHLILLDEMGIWGSGVMVFNVGAPLLCLGAHHTLARYVSAFEARGRLLAFYRWARVCVVALVLLMAGVSLLGCESVLRWISEQGLTIQAAILQQSRLRLAVLGNLVLMALYLAQVSFMYGLRTYNLVSLTEVVFSVVFTVGALGWVAADPSAHSLFLAHMLSLAITLLGSSVLLGMSVRRIARETASGHVVPLAEKEPELEAGAEAEGDSIGGHIPLSREKAEDAFRYSRRAGWARMARFGIVAMLGQLVWQAAGYVSLFMVLRYYGEESGGAFYVILQFAQPLLFLSNAAWTVLYSHVTRRWEGGDRSGALYVLETSYKAIGLTVTTFTILLYVSSPWWIRVLGPQYQCGYYLSGMFTFFLSISNMTMLTIPARLHERPIIIAVGALAGAALNAALAALWMPGWGEIGAARAAGVGMFFGGLLVMLLYLLISGTRFSDSTYVVLITPALLLLPTWILGPLWAIVLPVCLFSSWMFTSRQRKLLHDAIGKGWRSFWRMMAWKRSP
jgi:O-antigen/teichoic acid export membrane protein